MIVVLRIIFRYIVSIAFLVLSCDLLAQPGEIALKRDSISGASVAGPKVKKPRVKRDFKPSSFKVGGDVLGFGRSLIESDYTHYEAQFDVDFHRYFFVVDVGRQEHSFSGSSFAYSNDGNYFRVGIQANMTQFNEDRNVIFFGLRYARSNFSDKLNFTQATDHWGSGDIALNNNGLSARWFELNTGMKVRVTGQLYLGYTIRFKLAKSMSQPTSTLQPYTIPGFGLASKGSNIGFNYYILYRLPFRNKPVPKKVVRPGGTQGTQN